MGWTSNYDGQGFVCKYQSGRNKVYWISDDAGDKSVCSQMSAFLNKHDSTIKAECVTETYYGRKIDAGIKSAAGKCDVMLALMTKARTAPCNYNDCGGKGSCAAKSASTTCTCGDAFTNFENTCVTNSCTQNECVADNTESCSVTGEGTYACACKKGFAGNRCQEDVDGCAGNPCGANGDCADTAGAITNDVAYTCTCKGNCPYVASHGVSPSSKAGPSTDN